MKDEFQQVNDYALEEFLSPRESLLWQGKPHKGCYMIRSTGVLLPFALIWLLFDTAFIVVMLSVDIPGNVLWFAIPFFAIHLMPVWILIGKWVKARLAYPNVLYGVTSYRLLLRDGAVGIDFQSVDYAEITGVSVNVGLIEKSKDVGTVIVKTSSATYRLLSIPEPYEVYKLLQQTSYDVKTDVEYPNAQRPTYNPGYSTQIDESEWKKL